MKKSTNHLAKEEKKKEQNSNPIIQYFYNTTATTMTFKSIYITTLQLPSQRNVKRLGTIIEGKKLFVEGNLIYFMSKLYNLIIL